MPPSFTVLIADDDAEDRNFLKECLSATTKLQVIGELASGTDLIAYLSGTAPFQDRARHPLPDLLIIDSIMPKLEAGEILHWLKAHPVPRMKVIIFSGFPTPDTGAHFIKHGAHGFFYKTGELHQLKSITREIETHLLNGDYDR
ncbi:MAG: response regulator [Pedosphaera sp.]|nr:response regulator [Pedosphaera sp.]